ncbi:MAG: histidine phosphatase family protein, partial [Acidimicrobiia bacterium]
FPVMARLVLVRHAPTAETGKTLYGRLPGHPLSAQGLEMAAEVAERLASVKVTAVYASPLDRAMQTAEVIATRLRKRVLTHDGLIEVDYGKWAGRSLRSLYKLKAWRTVVTTPSRVRFPEGESLLEAQTRMVRTCQDLADRHRNQAILAVSHADTIKMALSHYLGQPLDLCNRIAVAPASVAVIDLPEGGSPRVVTMNSNGDPTTWQ